MEMSEMRSQVRKQEPVAFLRSIQSGCSFQRQAKVVREIFDRFLGLARDGGPVTVYAQRTRIIFQVLVRFGGAVPKKKWLQARLWLKRRAEHPRLARIESYGRLGYGHYFRLAKTSDVDIQLAKLMREAYLVGEQRSDRSW
jgi:hypothetical protein